MMGNKDGRQQLQLLGSAARNGLSTGVITEALISIFQCVLQGAGAC